MHTLKQAHSRSGPLLVILVIERRVLITRHRNERINEDDDGPKKPPFCC